MFFSFYPKAFPASKKYFRKDCKYLSEYLYKSVSIWYTLFAGKRSLSWKTMDYDHLFG